MVQDVVRVVAIACGYTKDTVAVRVAEESLECLGIGSVEPVGAVAVSPSYELLEVGTS